MKKKTPSKKKSKITQKPSKKKAVKSTKKVSSSAEVEVAVGYAPALQLKPQDDRLFRQFQSNLVSLISHELRTPLSSLMSAFALWDEKGHGVSQAEIVTMLRRNALRLNQSLSMLLDMAEMGSGIYQLNLREVKLSRLLLTKAQEREKLWGGNCFHVDLPSEGTREIRVLGDPVKLQRAFDLLLDLAARYSWGTISVASEKSIRLSQDARRVEIRFLVQKDQESTWKAEWERAQVAAQSGVLSPSSAFAGLVQSENAFLTREEDGLGAELILAGEILRLHGIKLTSKLQGGLVNLSFEFPEISTEEGLVEVLRARIFEGVSGLKSVAFILIQLEPEADLWKEAVEIRRVLFRSSDSAYPLQSRHQVALLLEDCKAQDVPIIVSRMEKKLEQSWKWSAVVIPEEGSDAEYVVNLAEERLK